MKILLCISLVLPVFAQTGLEQNPLPDQPPSDQQPSEVMKDKDLHDSAVSLHRLVGKTGKADTNSASARTPGRRCG
jgi:hypothetical protein